MKGFLAVAAAVVLGAAGLFTALGVAGDNPHGGFVPGSTVGPGDHVPICHALGNGGYELIAPSAGVVFGHAGSSHQDGRDVIPPFVYQPQGNGSPDTSLAGGQNWAAGQALWANDCEAATTSTTSTSTTSTSTTSTTTSTSTSTTSTTS